MPSGVTAAGGRPRTKQVAWSWQDLGPRWATTTAPDHGEAAATATAEAGLGAARWQRSPADVGRLAVAASFLAASIVVATFSASASKDVASDLAALVAGLSAIGIPTSQATAIAIVYRLFSYWFPIIPGYVSMLYLQRKKAI